MDFYASKDDTVLICSVVHYFNFCLYYVTMTLMRNGITGYDSNDIFRYKNSKTEVKSVICILDEIQKYESCSFLIYI